MFFQAADGAEDASADTAEDTSADASEDASEDATADINIRFLRIILFYFQISVLRNFLVK